MMGINDINSMHLYFFNYIEVEKSTIDSIKESYDLENQPYTILNGEIGEIQYTYLIDSQSKSIK